MNHLFRRRSQREQRLTCRAAAPPPCAGDNFASAWASLAFGAGVVTALKVLEPSLERKENELADALQERFFTFALALGGIGIWHGLWCGACLSLNLTQRSAGCPALAARPPGIREAAAAALVRCRYAFQDALSPAGRSN